MKASSKRWFGVLHTAALIGICVAAVATGLRDLMSSEIGAKLSPVLFIGSQEERGARPLPSDAVQLSGEVTLTSSPRNILILSFDHDRATGRQNAMIALDAILGNTRIKNVAFEFPRDMQRAFDSYFASRQDPPEMMRLTMAMLARFPDASRLSHRQKIECAARILRTESIHSLIDVAWIAKRHGAHVLLVDIPMNDVSPGDPKLILRNREMARRLIRFSSGERVLLLVGNAHTGHGTLNISIDDQLSQLGASTMSICTDSRPVPSLRSWGTEQGTADYRVAKPLDVLPLVAKRFPDIR